MISNAVAPRGRNSSNTTAAPTIESDLDDRSQMDRQRAKPRRSTAAPIPAGARRAPDRPRRRRGGRARRAGRGCRAGRLRASAASRRRRRVAATTNRRRGPSGGCGRAGRHRPAAGPHAPQGCRPVRRRTVTCPDSSTRYWRPSHRQARRHALHDGGLASQRSAVPGGRQKWPHGKQLQERAGHRAGDDERDQDPGSRPASRGWIGGGHVSLPRSAPRAGVASPLETRR